MFEGIKKYLFSTLLLLDVLSGNAQHFKVLNGIPHLPSFLNNTAVSSPATGMMIYSQTVNGPEIYTGTIWTGLVTASLTEATNKPWFVVKNGIPCMPAFDGAVLSGLMAAIPIGTIFYDTGINSFQIWKGDGWVSFTGLQLFDLTEGNKFRTNYNADGFMIPFFSAAPAGCQQGAIYFNTVQKTLVCYNGTNWQTIATPSP